MIKENRNPEVKPAAIPSVRMSAIDVGSNAIRMIVVESAPESQNFRVIKKYRIALRLGEDVFGKGYITPRNLQATVRAFESFLKINHENQVTLCRAVGTSACREASNRNNLVDLVLKKTGIHLEIIDGREEGQLVHLAVNQRLREAQSKSLLLIDIGGGSVEITFAKEGYSQATKSFEIGTVRLLKELARRKLNISHLNVLLSETLEGLHQYLHPNSDRFVPEFAVGTGGNLECLGELRVRLLKRTSREILTLSELDQIIHVLKSLSIAERSSQLKLNLDRADVILPAAMVLHLILRQADIKTILIPRVGLREGLIWSLLKKTI